MAKAKLDQELGLLISSGEWKKAILAFEEYELEIAADGISVGNAPNYAIQLLMYLLCNDLNNAKYLWKRISPNIKSSAPELEAVWKVGQAIWAKNYVEVYKCLRGFSWSDPVRQLISVLEDSFRKSAMTLLSESYTAVSISDACSYLGLTTADVVKAAAQLNWGIDQASNMLMPKPIEIQKDRGTSLVHLQQLTDYFCHLESQ